MKKAFLKVKVNRFRALNDGSSVFACLRPDFRLFSEVDLLTSSDF